MKMRILTSLQLFIVCLLGFSFCVSADVLDPIVDNKSNFSNYSFYGSQDSPNYIAGTYWKNEWIETPEIGSGTGYLKTTYEPLALRNNRYYGVNRLLTMSYTAYQQNGYRPSTDVGSVYEGELYGSTSLLQGGYTEISDATVNATSDLVASGGGGSIDISGSAFNGQTELTAMDGGTINVDTLQIADDSSMEKYFGGFGSGQNWFYRISVGVGYIRIFFARLTDFLFRNMGYSDSPESFIRDYSWILKEHAPSFTGTVKEVCCTAIPLFTFSVKDERITFTRKNVFCDLHGVLKVVSETTVSLVTAVFNLFAEWFYPLDSTAPFYWEYFNTDTGKAEKIGLAGLMYNISWYLGQMFQMNSWDLGDSGLQQSADELDQTIQDYDKAENEIFGTVNGYLDQFLPDPGDFASLKAIGWIGDFLQQSFVSLGAYSIPITIALVLGVCMQFLGYFKFKV